MDKREYQEKLQEINRLIAAEDYEGAAQIADSIDWKRVRNVQTLVMISEVYEALERYDDSKVLLLRAYRRSPVGRTVLYRLVECCIRLRQFDQAIEYYSEYVQAAPHDNNKYILKYKIYRGRGASLDEQIDILKEYLDQEYNEKWAYELARLQIQADRTQEGLATCDDLVLWFHSGKYVIKALELKKKYAPLTPKQQEIYDNRFETEEEPETQAEPYLSETPSLAKAERAAAAQEEIKSELAADISHTARMEATKVELSRKAEEAQAQIERKAELSREALAPKKEVPGRTASGKIITPARLAGKDAWGEEKASDQPASQSVSERVSEGTSVAGTLLAGAAAAVTAESLRDAFASEPESESEERRPAEAVPDKNGSVEAVSQERVSGGAAEENPQAAGMPGGDASEGIEESPIESMQQEDPVRHGSPEQLYGEESEPASAEQPKAKEGEPAPADRVQAKEGEPAPADLVQESEGEPAPADQIQEDEAKTASADQLQEDNAETASAEQPQANGIQTAQAEELQEDAEEPVSPEQLQQDMVRNMREIVSGVGPKDMIGADEAILDEAIEQSKEDQENAVAARGTDLTFRVPMSEASQKRQAGRLTIDDILLSMGDGGDRIRKVAGGFVMSADEEAQMTAQQQAQAQAASSYAQSAADGPASSDVAGAMKDGAETDDSQDPEIPRFLRDDVHEARQTAEIPAMEIAAAQDALNAEAASGEQETVAAAVAAAFMSAPKVEYTKEIAEAKTRRLPVEEIRKLHEAYLSDNAAAEEAARNASQAAEKAADMAEAELGAASGLYEEEEDIRIAGTPGMRQGASPNPGMPGREGMPGAGQADGADAGRPDQQGSAGAGYAAAALGAGVAAALGAGYAGEPAAGMPGREAVPGTGYAGEPAAGMPGREGVPGAWYANGTDMQAPDPAGQPGPVRQGRDGQDVRGPETEGVMAASEESYGEAAFARSGRIGEQVTREVPKSEPEPEVLTGRPRLKENQRDLFMGFTSIGNLEEQIAAAIWQAENRKDDRTSRSGNILILGAHGCGKTTIATGIAKAIAEDKGTHSVKMARIYAADLNRKDIAATIAKIAGGVLIVEEAGDLDDAIVDQLTTAMEFRTDGMIMILEDEQRYIHELLMRHPRFTMKFTAQIYIPEYTGEDLVSFGRIYADSKDFALSEKAAQACRDMIEAAKQTGEAVSVTNVIELMDRAMKHANTFFRRIGSAKKRYDSEDRVILLEKDFR